MGDLEKFTAFLFDGLTGYVYAPIKGKDNSWTQNFFQWPQQKAELHDYIRTSCRDGDVYIAPAIFSEKSGTKAAVKSAKVVWVEFDGNFKDFKGLPYPNMIVQSSTEDHKHCYWQIPETNAPVVEEINHRLTYFLEADSSGWDVSQVLRPPETFNWKVKLQPKEVKLTKLDYTPVELPVFDSAPDVELPTTVVEYDDLIDPKKIDVPKELQALVFERMPGPNQRSSMLMFAAHAMAEHGFNHLQMVSLLYHMDYRIKKFVGRSDQLVRLSQIADIALLRIDADNYIEGYSPLEIVNHEQTLDWYIPGWLHSRGLMLVSGAPGVGKTQFALFLSYQLATGTEILGREPVSPLGVGVLSLEMDIVELKYIFSKQQEGFEKKELWNSNVRVFAPDEPSLLKFEKIISEHKPKVVVIDSLSEMANEDLKESEARTLMRWFKKMRREYGCAFIVIHHNRKANDSNKKPRKLSDLYGSFVFGKLSETVISLWQDEGRDYLEVDTFKARFGSRQPIKIKRTEHLTFELVQESVAFNGNPILEANAPANIENKQPGDIRSTDLNINPS